MYSTSGSFKAAFCACEGHRLVPALGAAANEALVTAGAFEARDTSSVEPYSTRVTVLSAVQVNTFALGKAFPFLRFIHALYRIVLVKRPAMMPFSVGLQQHLLIICTQSTSYLSWKGAS
jgi:hypothetical protein